jgi:lipopolysaccharide export system permease protein
VLYPGILHRSIFFELAKVFILSLVALTGIIVLAAIVQEATQRGLGPEQILTVIPLLVPSMMPFIIPPTTLFASCIVYGRLSHDNEITAIRAAGITVLHVVWPGVVLGLLMSATTMGLYYYLIPHTQRLLRSIIVHDVEDFLYTMLRKDREIRRRPDISMGYEMWVESVQGKVLKNAIFMRRDAQGNYDVVAKAREADLHVGDAIVVHMRHCHVFDEAGKVRGYFAEREWTVPVPEIKERMPGARELTWREGLEARKLAVEEAERNQVRLAEITAALAKNPAAAKLEAERANYEYLCRHSQQRANALTTELHMRPALACGCFFFVLVGCPVGIWFSKSDYLSAFITCFLPIVFLYYPIQLCSTNLAKDGKAPAAVALWMANGAMGLIAVGLFRKLMRN